LVESPLYWDPSLLAQLEFQWDLEFNVPTGGDNVYIYNNLFQHTILDGYGFY